MSIYTGAGDHGLSSTIKYRDISKAHPVFEVLGNIDELMSQLGVAVTESPTISEDIVCDLKRVQKTLIAIASEIAGGFPAELEDEIFFLESRTDAYEGMGLAPGVFKVKGDSKEGASIDLGRAITRRLERSMLVMHGDDKVRDEVIAYVNRLSDYLFMLARYVDFEARVVGRVMNATRVGENEATTASRAEAAKAEIFSAGETISVKLAELLCKSLIKIARHMGFKCVASVCDSGGNAVCMMRDDGAFVASVDIAMNKAWTSVALQMTTEEVGNLTRNGGELQGLENTNNGRIVNFGGGIPLRKNGKIVGALGVSGGSAEQDTKLAQAGERIYEELIGGKFNE